MISSMSLTASMRSLSTVNRPSAAAVSSIFPSLGCPDEMFCPMHKSRRMAAASSSWSIRSSFSHT